MIYTFYSYKGGVGRSMALANVAELFYRAGLRVLMVDWDLEAPGLERFFPTIDLKDFYTKPGLLDLILDYSEKTKTESKRTEKEINWEDENNLPFKKLGDYLFDVYPNNNRSNGRLWLLSAGRRSEEEFSKYANNVIDLNFSDLYQKQRADQYFEWLRGQFEKIADAIFIDSRTGLNEISGICTYQLADVVVMLTTVADQSLEGTLKILQSFKKHEYIKNRGRRHQSIIIPSRVDVTQGNYVDSFKSEFSTIFKRYTPKRIGSYDHRLWELMIPYVPAYSYKEKLVIPDRDKPHAVSLAEAYTKISAALSMLADDGSAIRQAMPETKIKIGEDNFSSILVNPGVALLGKSYYDTKKISLPSADWGNAPYRNPFFGRRKELKKLERWIINDGCRVVVVCGMGGIGKTDFSLKLAKQIQEEFDYVIWRTLRDAPSVSSILEDMIKHLSNQENVSIGIDFDDISAEDKLDYQLKLLINYLSKYRCLLILDNIESILRSDKTEYKDEPDLQGYGELFSQFGESYHQSCLLLTSREIPPKIANQSGDDLLIRFYELEGLNTLEGREFSTAIANNLEGSDDDWNNLIDFYRGHPLALDLATRHINEAFSGQIKDFLSQGAPVFQDLRNLLDWHFKRLSVKEQEIMYWLAINREPVPVQSLINDISDEQNAAKAASNLQSLKKCFPLEEVKGLGFSLQPVIIEYMTEKLIDEVYQEVIENNINLFNNLALMKATSKDYIRSTQVRLILEPLVKKLSHGMKDRKDIAKRLLKPILSKHRKTSYLGRGYLGGNILNLLCYLKVNISDYDFSGLYICQPYLQDKNLENVKFTNSEFSQAIFTQTFSSLLSVAFSPEDGKYLVTGDADGGIRLWEVSNLSQCCYIDAHTSWVRSVSFSNDDTLLASGSDDETVKVWRIDTEKGKLSDQPYRVFKDHKYRVRSVAFNPKDKMMVASSSFDKTVRIWDIEKNKCIRTLSEHTDWIWTAIFSQDGTRLVSSSKDGTLKIWNVKTGKCIHTLSVSSDIQSIAFSFDDRILAAACDDKTVKLWNFKTYQFIKSLSGHSDYVRSVAFNRNGMLASASYDNTVRLWNIEKGECTKVFVGHTHRLRSIAFSPRSDYLVSGGWDQTLKLWNVNEGGESLRTLQSRTDWICGADISPNGKLLISGSQDKILKLWDVENRKVSMVLRGHTNWIWAVAFSPNANLIASGGFDHTIRLWDCNSGKCLRTLSGHTNWVWSVVFSPNGKLLVSGSDDQVVKIWDVETGENLKDFTDKSSEWVRSVAFSSDNELVASGSDDRKIRLWSVSTGNRLRLLEGHESRVRSLAFSPTESILASGSYDKTVKIWDLQTGRCLKTLSGHTQKVRSIAFSRDGKILASGGNDETIRLWDPLTGVCFKILEGHTDEVRSVAFSRNKDILVSSSKDGTIRIWNSQTGDFITCLRELPPYEGMDITGVIGLSDLQKASLIALGAISNDS